MFGLKSEGAVLTLKKAMEDKSAPESNTKKMASESRQKSKIKEAAKATKHIKNQDPLQALFKNILKGDNDCQANKELPQALIHYEVVLAQSWRNTSNPGLKKIAQDDNNCFLSALTGGSVKKILTEENFTDDLKTLKSRLIWGEK